LCEVVLGEELIEHGDARGRKVMSVCHRSARGGRSMEMAKVETGFVSPMVALGSVGRGSANHEATSTSSDSFRCCPRRNTTWWANTASAAFAARAAAVANGDLEKIGALEVLLGLYPVRTPTARTTAARRRPHRRDPCVPAVRGPQRYRRREKRRR
jgi:hypothetical protein